MKTLLYADGYNLRALHHCMKTIRVMYLIGNVNVHYVAENTQIARILTAAFRRPKSSLDAGVVINCCILTGYRILQQNKPVNMG